MPNPLITIETSEHFFCGNDRGINVNSNIKTEKHLTLVPRYDIPHGSNVNQLATPTPLASPLEENHAVPGKEKKSWTPAERRQFVENKVKEAVGRLLDSPNEIYHINISVYHRKSTKPERLTVNVDFIFDQGTKPFKTSADCVSRSRMREITSNVDKEWGGYAYAKSQLQQWENTMAFAGKLKNRKQHKALIPQRIVPKTAVIIKPKGNRMVAEIIIDSTVYTVDLHAEENPKSMKFFQLRGSIQTVNQTEWEI